jgi:hypothetical protein
MRTADALVGLVAPLAVVLGLQSGAAQERPALSEPLNTLADIGRALNACWEWPALEAVQAGMELTVLVSFKRNGEIFGARITHQSRTVSPEERDLYYKAMLAMLKRCSPLPVSESLGAAIAGRPFTFRIVDTRKQRKA